MDFEKIAFFDSEAIFGLFQPLGNHFFIFLSKSRGILSKVLHVKNDFPGAAKGPKIASESKNAIFSKFKIMIP